MVLPIIEAIFMYILKINAMKDIRISVTSIAKAIERNTRMQDELNCQIPSIKNDCEY